MSDLRTRLLHVLIDSTPPQYLPPPNDLSRILDAVIAELGLETERQVGPGEPGEGLLGFIRYVRYVTGWEVDE